MSDATLVFPHQLFERHPGIRRDRQVVLIEDDLFFGDRRYPLSFHQQKLVLHRASLREYEATLRKEGHEVVFWEYDAVTRLEDRLADLVRCGVTRVHYCAPHDFILERRLNRFAVSLGLQREVLPSPLFLTPDDWRQEYFTGRRRFLMGAFYQAQRKRLGILLDERGGPVGGRWSYDEDNRRKYPKDRRPPDEPCSRTNTPLRQSAIRSVARQFPGNPGEADRFSYPTTHGEARHWLRQFLMERFHDFGPYEDAISTRHRVLHHAVLTPALNIGLLTPTEVVDDVLEHAREHAIPLNSVEGFVRQVIGWREFMLGVYHEVGVRARTSNFWGFTRRMPRAFYSATTGIPPVDATLRRVLETGWCHHIERLMILGNFMLLCRIHPDDVYAWFMEMFIDSSDWVMVPNVYGMSQFADGGTFTTKPYLSGSNYLLKMSDHSKGPWCAVWDALFWTFIADHETFFASHPRLGMMHRQLDRLRGPKLEAHRRTADAFLSGLF